VRSFAELGSARFGEGVNALCWERTLPGDFAEIVRALGPGEDVATLDEATLHALTLSAQGQVARDVMLRDQQRLRELDLDPVLNCIHGYPRDDEDGPVPTDVFSFHVDRASVETDTWLCTYYGPASEGLRNEEAQRKVDLPAIRRELLSRFAGPDDDKFAEYLKAHCYDLHYAAQEGARLFDFGVGHLWRIATDYPGSPVPPCLHRAPSPGPRDPPRLLLIC